MVSYWLSARQLSRMAVFSIAMVFHYSVIAAPSVYATGTTIYDPDKTWNGYTLLDTTGGQGAVLIDMNGRVLRHWDNLTMQPSPFRILPGGYIMGGDQMLPGALEGVALIQLDWDGNEVWRFDHAEQLQTEGGETIWVSRLHHDWQRQGNPVGYFAPNAEPLTSGGRTLILSNKTLDTPEFDDRSVVHAYLLEVSWEGEVLWEWLSSDHIDEFGFSEEARDAIRRAPSPLWISFNSASYVGPNRWFDEGDSRFHPDNIIFSYVAGNIIGIIDRSGTIVWRMGPDYRDSEALTDLGQILFQHHAHIIPRGLPGAGNLLVLDNGGEGGYGAGNPVSPGGWNAWRRFHSRVLEINPVTFEKVWEYSLSGMERFRFFSHYVGAAQRLPNGNTMITEGADGRLFEVTPAGEIVWEYVSPYFDPQIPTQNRVYRAYRVPYDWIPQLSRPEERRVVPPDLSQFRIEPQ